MGSPNNVWPAAPSIGGLRPPTSPADLTYPSIKRYTHGNSKGMKGRHPAYSKLCGLCSYYFFSVSIGITYGRRVVGTEWPNDSRDRLRIVGTKWPKDSRDRLRIVEPNGLRILGTDCGS